MQRYVYQTNKKVLEQINKVCKIIFGFTTQNFRRLTYNTISKEDKRMIQKVMSKAKEQNLTGLTAMNYYMWGNR
jgi:hypothetical protein